MINSESGYEADLVFENASFPEIPPNETGKSVVSLAQLARIRNDKLALWRPRDIGYISVNVANTILGEVETVRTLTRAEKSIVLNGITEFLNGPNR